MQKNALVLSGGGSRGAYQLGVWQALRELDFPIDIVTGTSVGALNAAMIATGDFENTRSLWMNMKTDMIFDVSIDETLPAKQKSTMMVRQFMHDYAAKGGMDSYPLKQLLDQYCDEQKIRENPIECGFVCVDKQTLKPCEIYKEDIEEGMLNEYLVASSSLYPAIKSHEIDGKQYIDGGYYDNLPVELATRKGADFVLAVDLEAVGMVRRETLKAAKTLIRQRCYWDLGPILVFDRDRISRNIRLGYLDTMKIFRVFDGIAYTFIRNEVPAFIKRKKADFADLNTVLGLTFGAKENVTKREELFFLRMKTFLDRKYNQQVDLRFSSFFKCCMESAGEIFGLSPETIYSVERFNERLTERVNALDVEFTATDKLGSLKNLQQTLALFEKPVRTLYLGTLMKKAVLEERKLDLLGLSLFLPDELLGAYYLALIS